MRILICDEASRILLMRNQICKQYPQTEFLFDNYFDLTHVKERIDEVNYDIAIMNHRLKKGMEVIRYLRKKQDDCLILFICKDKRDLNEAFVLNIHTFLFINQDSLFLTIFHRLYREYQVKHYQLSLIQKSGIVMINPQDIIYIVKEKNNVRVITNKESFTGEIKNLNEVMELLKYFWIEKIHTRYYVQTHSIKYFKKGEVGMSNGDFLPCYVAGSNLIHEGYHVFRNIEEIYQKIL